jgi:hypothetical protein
MTPFGLVLVRLAIGFAAMGGGGYLMDRANRIGKSLYPGITIATIGLIVFLFLGFGKLMNEAP